MKFFQTLQKELSGKPMLIAFGIAVLYIIISVYMANYRIIAGTLLGNYPFEYKRSLLESLAVGSWGMFRPMELILLIVIAILMGITMSLMGKTLREMRGKKGMRLSFGGSSMLAVVSVGCPSCGISLLSMLGVSSSFLPFSGVPMQITSIVLMIGSLIYILHKLQTPMACETPSISSKAKRE